MRVTTFNVLHAIERNVLHAIERMLVALVLLGIAGGTGAAESSWEEIEKAARGQTVYWNSWGGDEKVNAYIAWVGEQVGNRYGLTLHHVKVTDIAETVSRILAEKYAGRDWPKNTRAGTKTARWI